MAKLPDNAELRKLFNLGFRDQEVADKYGSSRQAVSKRWRAMGLIRAPFTQQARQLLEPLGVRGGHDQSWISKALRMVIRRRLGDVLSPTSMGQATQWLSHIRENNLIVTYDSEHGWDYDVRRPTDGNLLLRWPEDAPLPDDPGLQALVLPSEEEGLTPIAQLSAT